MHQPKWEGKVKAKLEGLKPDQVWPVLQDFFNLHKWFPTLSTCYGIHGTNGQPGCIRYCAGSSFRSSCGNSERIVSWSTEKLLEVDHVGLSLSYEMVGGNIGFENYVASMRVMDDADDRNGCLIQWSFTVDPVKGCPFEDLIEKYEKGLGLMATRIKENLMCNI